MTTKKITTWMMSILLMFLLAAAFVSAQEAISGIIKNTAGDNISDANVTISYTINGTVLNQTTTVNGMYSMTFDMVGTFNNLTLTIEKMPAYLTITSPVAWSDNQTREINRTMGPAMVNTISGFITNACTQNEIGGAQITMQAQNLGESFTTTSGTPDSTGAYQRLVLNDSYSINVSLNGFIANTSETVNATNMSAVLNVTLTPTNGCTQTPLPPTTSSSGGGGGGGGGGGPNINGRVNLLCVYNQERSISPGTLASASVDGEVIGFNVTYAGNDRIIMQQLVPLVQVPIEFTFPGEVQKAGILNGNYRIEFIASRISRNGGIRCKFIDEPVPRPSGFEFIDVSGSSQGGSSEVTNLEASGDDIEEEQPETGKEEETPTIENTARMKAQFGIGVLIIVLILLIGGGIYAFGRRSGEE